MITVTCQDKQGLILLEFGVSTISPLSKPYAALEDCVKETKTELTKQNKLSELDRIKVMVLNEKWLPDANFEAKINPDGNKPRRPQS